MSARVHHHFTVDVEEVFHSTLLTDRIPSSRWEDYPRRGPDVVRWLLVGTGADSRRSHGTNLSEGLSLIDAAALAEFSGPGLPSGCQPGLA